MFVHFLSCAVTSSILPCRHDSIQGKERLLKEFSAADDAVMKKDVKRPAEHKALFSGTNTDDHFCLGIKVTRGAVRYICATCAFLSLRHVKLLSVVGMPQHWHSMYESTITSTDISGQY